jgi:hypothetical protein
MKKHMVVLALLGIFGVVAAGACQVSAGITPDTSGGGSCEDLSCSDALASGLSVQGDALCDGTSDSDYNDLVNCGCNGGPCADACADNLCTDSGDSSDCDDCLNANCGDEYDTCNSD